jgi:hypothetical protein
MSPNVAHDYAGVAQMHGTLAHSARARGQHGSAHKREAAHTGEPKLAGMFCINILTLVGNIATSKPIIPIVSA